MSKVVLTHGYFLSEDSKERQIMRPYPPLGLLYISAYLEKMGVENTVFDTTFSSVEKLKTYLLQEKPRYIGIYVNLMTKLKVLEIIRFIKTTPEISGTNVFLGGPEVRFNAEDFLRHGADWIVIGEGEESTHALIAALEAGTKNFETIPGLAFLNTKGDVITTEPREKIKNIDELPYPNRSAIDLHQYLNVWKTHHGLNAVSVSTMRGCPYTCKWCSRAVYGLSYRRRSPEKVVEELELIHKKYNPDTLWFVDDVFTISHKWLAGFQEALKAKKLSIRYECITRADRLNEEVLDVLKQTGCFRVWIGAESGSQKVIDLMDRRVDVNQVRSMIQLATKKGIQAGTFIMLGYPGETEADIEETIRHLKTSNPDHFTITVAYPIKGTEMFQEIEAFQTLPYEFDKKNDRDRDFKRTYPRTYYNFAVSRVYNEVYYYKSLSTSGITLQAAKF